MRNIKEVADAAEMIVNGYAFTKDCENVRVLNLNNPHKAVYLSRRGDVLETSMDDIELEIVLEYYQKNRKYMEE
ncbi:MAG: hypothetical protein Q4B90_02330 [Eubacteriales bacterium]|nr:hypothetical protein [Eubacteriales bacterium]